MFDVSNLLKLFSMRDSDGREDFGLFGQILSSWPSHGKHGKNLKDLTVPLIPFLGGPQRWS